MEKEEVIIILKDARKLIEAGYCQGFHATDKEGNPAHYSSVQADKFDAIGACLRVNKWQGYQAIEALNVNKTFDLTITQISDMSKEDCLELFDAALKHIEDSID